MSIRKTRRISSFELSIIVLLGVAAAVALFPFYNVLIQSFSE